MKKKIFFRFFSVTLVAVLLMFVFGVFAVKRNSESIMTDRLKEETKLVCALVKDESDFSGLSEFASDDAFRVTVVDLRGDVVFESDTDAPLENHSDREEIINAINGTPRTVKRYSETFGFDTTYYAVKTAMSNGDEVVVRLAIRSSRINDYLDVALPILVGVLIVALVASVIASRIFSNNVANKISDIGVSLRSLNDGDYRPIDTDSGSPELFAVMGEINALSDSLHRHIRDVSDEKNKLNTVLENVSQGIVAIDSDSKIVFANESATDIFNCSSKLENKNIVYLIDDEVLCAKMVEASGKNVRFDYGYKGRDLSVVVRTPKGYGNGAVFSIFIVTDVTEEKALQRQKNEFFANASHELKTPVTVMQGLSEILLSKDRLSDEERKRVERIHSESVRLASLVSDMLKLSKLENGISSRNDDTKVNLRSILEEVVGELSDEIESKGLIVEIDGDATVVGEEAKMFEIVQNLISNAVHYNVQGGKVTVKLDSGETGVVLKVEDTGIGVEKENIPRLCERFFRVDKSRSKKTGGTGLGLAIVKYVCALYDAKLSIDSTVGEGTVVTVEFPRRS